MDFGVKISEIRPLSESGNLIARVNVTLELKPELNTDERPNLGNVVIYGVGICNKNDGTRFAMPPSYVRPGAQPVEKGKTRPNTDFIQMARFPEFLSQSIVSEFEAAWAKLSAKTNKAPTTAA